MLPKIRDAVSLLLPFLSSFEAYFVLTLITKCYHQLSMASQCKNCNLVCNFIPDGKHHIISRAVGGWFVLEWKWTIMVRRVNLRSKALKSANKILQMSKDDVMPCTLNWSRLTRMKALKNPSISSILTQKC